MAERDDGMSARSRDDADRRRKAITVSALIAVAMLVAFAVVLLAVRGSEQAWIAARSNPLDPSIEPLSDEVDVEHEDDATNVEARGGATNAQARAERSAIETSKATVALSGFVRNITGAEPLVPECELTFDVG